MPNDQGIYSVIAHNPAGRTQSQARLNVSKGSDVDRAPITNPDAFKYLNRPRESARPEEAQDVTPPKVVVPLANVQLIEGRSMLLACKITGSPSPRVSYFI